MPYRETGRPFDQYFYAASHLVVGGLTKVLFGLKAYGAENIPEEGAALIAANHRHFLDVIALPVSIPKRHLTVLARDTLYDHSALRFLFTHWDALPISREGFTVENYRNLDARLQAGRLVAIFPESTRGDKHLRKSDPSANLGEFFPGIAKFTRRHNVPTVPVAIAGLDHALTLRHTRHARVVFGEPLDSPSGGREANKVYINELRRRVECLYDQARAC